MPHTSRTRPATPRRLLPGLAALLLLSIPLAGRSACKLQSFDMPVTMSGTRAVATLRLNGVATPLTVDSGAFFSAITTAAASQLKLRTRAAPEGFRAWGLTGSIDFRVARVERLGFQNAEIPDVEFLVGGNEPGAGTMGLLGRNLLSWADTEYDLAHGMIRMMQPKGDCADVGLAYWAGATPVAEAALESSSREHLPPIRVQATINGKPITAVFDTGATSILSLSAARRAGLVKDGDTLQPAGPVHGAGRGELPSWLVPVARFELGGERIDNSRIRVADFDLDDGDMLIGIDFFLSHRIYVSKSQQRLYFTYHGGPVFDLSLKVATPAGQGATPDEPQDAAAFARRGSAFAARRDLERALSDFDRACALDPATGAHFARRARVRLQLRQPAQALSDFNEALRLDPSDHEARLDRARLAAGMRDVGLAQADLQALDGGVAPQSPLRRGMGELYLLIGEPAKAVPQFDHWTATRRKEVDLHHVLNARCWARGLAAVDLDKALDDCNDALDEKPNEAAYLDSRGLVYLRQGQFAKALADYDEALRQRPEQAWTLLGRGLARWRMGRTDEGRADIAEARRLQPSIEAQARRHGLELP